MEQSIFIQLSLILAVAAGLSMVLRAFRQPLIIGYILTGFIAGPSLLNIVHDQTALTSFSQIGIALLLFIIGLGLNASTIRATGKPVLITFGLVILGVGGITGLTSQLLGLPPTDSWLLATCLLFSSTIIVITALSNKREQSRLYGQIAIGVLLVEDIVATLSLLFVGSLGGHDALQSGWLGTVGVLVLKGTILGCSLTLAGMFILPPLNRFLARSQELLFIFALAWAFGVASLFYAFGFSLEVGALFAGVALAHLPYAQEVSNRLKPLRDFFIVLFFVELGQNLKLGTIVPAIGPAILASLAVLVLKPLLVLTGLGALGYTKQTGFKAAVHLSQISEFSIILTVLAVGRGLVAPDITAIVTLTMLITIVGSAYLMKYDDRLYRRFSKFLSHFERKQTKRELRALQHYPLVLLGYRGGPEFVHTFQKMDQKYIVIDYDPEVIEQLDRLGVNHLYGDVTDLELLEEISLHDSELVVSTIPDVDTNILLVRHIMGHVQRGVDKPTIFVCHAATLDEAVRLYEHGASYVLLPQLIGNEKASSFIRRNGSDKAAYDAYRQRHMAHLAANKA